VPLAYPDCVLLFLVRHGETDSNRDGLALGRADPPLNETGRRQAEQVARTLAGEAFSAVYSSPLQRAVETARQIAAPHGLEVRAEPGLIEMDVGEMDGLTFKEVRERYPDFIEAWRGSEGPATSMPGGERLLDVLDRAWRTVASLQARHEQETVCAVTHNFVILTLLTRALGLDPAAFRKLRHSVAGITVLEFDGERVTVLRMNDTCHLDADR
jgi:broad specificity phosphatase PhoE